MWTRYVGYNGAKTQVTLAFHDTLEYRTEIAGKLETFLREVNVDLIYIYK
jgi:hypothetical protein